MYDCFVLISSPFSTDSRESILVERSKELMEEHLASVGLDSLSPTTIVGTNSILEDVIEACEKYDIDFIVMRSSGVSGLERLFIGSNTERLVRNSKVSIVVIKNELNTFVYDTKF